MEFVGHSERGWSQTAVVITYWEKGETKEKLLLWMSVKDMIIPHIRDCETSKEMWDVLKGLFKTKNVNIILFLKTKLLIIKMEANENISTFICKVKNLRDHLGTIGEKVWDSDLVTITLKCLLKDYQVFISSLHLEHNILHILNC